MGSANSTAKPAAPPATTAIPSECPMHQGNQNKAAEAKDPTDVKPLLKAVSSAMADTSSIPSECPMHAGKAAEATEWRSECPSNAATASSTLSNSDVDPLNMMPPPNQRPSPDQPFPLPTDRQKSTIPKATAPEGETWVYPSQQMFWNAMLRKGWRWKEESDINPEVMVSKPVPNS